VRLRGFFGVMVGVFDVLREVEYWRWIEVQGERYRVRKDGISSLGSYNHSSAWSISRFGWDFVQEQTI
jgi:hypothetical protein